MKVKDLFYVLFAAAAVLVGCQPKEEDFGEPSMDLSASELSIPMDGGSVTLQLTASRDWVVKTDAGWIQVNPDKGEASKSSVTVTISAPANTGFDRTAEVEFYGGKLADEFVTISQLGPDGNPDAIKAITVKEFIQKADTEKQYQLSGTVSNISNSTSYKAFDLTDDTGTVLVFFPVNFDEYATTLAPGGKITVVGKYEYYAAKSQHEVVSAEIVEYVAPAPIDPSTIQQITCAEFIAKADPNTTYRLVGQVVSSVNTSYCSFDMNDGTAKVVVWTVNNKDEWKDIVKKGGTVTVRGKYQKYTDASGNVKDEMVDAYIEKFVEGEGDKPIEGTSLIKNGGFEEWSGDKPAYWTFKSGNATLAKSSDAFKGSASVEVQGADANRRMMSDVYTLKPGTYQIAAYVKGDGQYRLGYAVVTNGSIKDTSNDYHYVTDAASATSEWKQVFETFTLTQQTDVSLIVMNNKAGNGASVFVDEFTLITNDGGVIEGQGGEVTEVDHGATKVSAFLSAAETTTDWYELTGVISDLEAGNEYGNFNLTDDSGSVYVYGVVSEKGGEKKKFQDLVKKYNIDNGGTITIKANRGSYNGKIEATNAYFVSYKAKEGGDTPGGDTPGGNTPGGDTPGGDTPGEITNATVAQFIAAEVSTSKYYRLTGVVKDIAQTTYGNFNLVDATGSVYVYGLTATKLEYDTESGKWPNDKSFGSLGIAVGDTLTIVGTRALYGETIEMCGAYCEKVVKGQGGDTPGGDTPGGEATNEFTSSITWTLGSSAYDKTTSSSQTATINGKSVDNLLKLGTSSKAGEATLSIPAGTTKIGFYAVGWKGSSNNELKVGDKTVTVAGNDGASGNPPYTMTVSDSDYYTVEVSAGDVKITCDKRVIIFGINAK